MFQLVYCVGGGGSLKNLCHFEMGGGLANADVIRGGRSMLTVADVICERSLLNYFLHFLL